ncbi:unnamed protein product [Discula destructiva]
MATTTSKQIDILDKIDLCDIPAIIKWADNQPRGVGSSLASTPVSLDVDFDPSTTTASFRLRIALLQRGSDNAVPLFLLIGSPQIRSLTVDNPDHATDAAARPVPDATCLHFQLSCPSTLIGPPEALRLKDKSQLTAMRSVRWAARQTALTLYIPDHVLSAHQITGLRDAPYSQCTSSLRHTDIGRLYGGRGGKVLTGTDDAPSGNAPPSYEDVPAAPPMAPIAYDSDIAASSKKRRRIQSPAEDSDVSVIERLCRKLVDDQYERTRLELSNMESRLIQRLEQGMNDQVQDLKETWTSGFHKIEGQMQELRKELNAKTYELENKTQELDDSCQAEIERLNEWMQEISDDIDKRVDLEVEDRVTGIKIDLEGFVKDELSTTADTLKHRIAEASVYIEFKE